MVGASSRTSSGLVAEAKLFINPRLRACAARVIAVRLSVCGCVCVRVSVRLSTVFLGNRGNSERETWNYQVGGMHGKLRFWSEEGRESWRN